MQDTAFLKYDALHIHCLVEGVFADARNILGDMDLGDPCPFAVPGRAGVGGNVIHIAAAAEDELSIGIKLPDDVLAAASAVEHLCIAHSILDAVVNCPLLSVAVRRNAQHDVGASVEGRVGNFRHIIRNVNRGQTGAVFEYSGSQEVRAAGQDCICQTCAVGEDIRSHGCYAVGDHDFGQGIVLQEYLLTDRFQAAVLFERNCLQIAGAHKRVIGKEGNSISNVQGFDCGAHSIPRHGIAACRRIHRAGAAELQKPVGVQHEPHVAAALTGKTHIGSRGIHKLSAGEHTDFVTDHVFALEAQAVFIEEVLLGSNADVSCLISSADEIHCAIAFTVCSPAGVQAIESIFGIAADAAMQDTVFTVIHISVFVVRAASLFLCIAVQKRIAPAAVVAGYCDLAAVSRDRQIYRFIIIGYNIKMEIGIVGNAVCLLAGRTADNVYDAILFIDLTAEERLSAGIGMVVAREHEINACCLCCRRNQIVDLSVAAGYVRVIRRLMDRQYLPGGICCRRIFLQPFQRCCQLLTVGGVVDDRDIDIAVNNGIMSAVSDGGQIVDQRGILCVCIACKLVVAQNVDHICLSKSACAKQLRNAHPVRVAGRIVNSVAGLDCKIVALILELGDDPLHIRKILRLNIAKDKELGRTIFRRCLECIFRRPDSAVADSVNVSFPVVKPGNHGAVDADHCIAALAEGHPFALRVYSGPDIAALELILEHLHGCAGIGKPGNAVLDTAVCGSMAHQAVGSKGRISGSVIAGDNIGEGEQAVCILRINRIVAGGCAEPIRNQHALFIGGADQGAVLQINADVLERLDVAGNLDPAVFAHQNRVCIKRIHAVNGKLHRFLRVCILRFANDILAGIQRIAEGIPALERGRNSDGDRQNRFSGRFRCLRCIDLDHTGQFVILIGALVSVCKFDLIIGEILVELDRKSVGGGGSRGGVLKLQRNIAAQHCGGFHRRKRYHRDFAQIVVALHKEAAGLFQLIAGSILCVNGNGVPAIRQGNAVDCVSSGVVRCGVVVIVVNYVYAVDIYAGGIGIDAGGVPVFHIHVVNEESHFVGGNGNAVRQLDSLTIAVVYGDLVDIRRIHVVDVRTVYKLEVIEVNRTGSFFAHLGRIYIHQAEGHTGKNGVRRIAVERCLAVMPALPPDAGICVGPGRFVGAEFLRLKGEVILTGGSGGILIIAAQPQSGGGAVAAPEDARSFRRIDPDADGGGGAGNGKRLGGTDACALGHSAAVSEVIVQLQTVRTHTDRLVIIDTDDLGRLDAASAVVGCIQQAGAVSGCILLVDRIVLLGGNDDRFAGIGIGRCHILEVPDDNRQLTDHHCELIFDLRLRRIADMDRTRDRQAFVCRVCAVRVECTHSFVGLRPCEIACIIVDIPALIFYVHGKLFRHVKAETHFFGLELNRVGMDQLNARRANDAASAAQFNSNHAGRAVSAGKQARCLVDGTHAGAIRVQSPDNVLRKLRRRARAVNADCGELHGGAGGIQVIIGRERRVVKFSRGLCVGNDHQSSEGRSFDAVGGGVLNLELTAAFSFRDKGGRSAAVTVDSLYAAKAEHGLRQLVHAHTYGIGRLPSVHDKQNDASVLLDADGGPRRAGAGCVIGCCIQAHAVAHQPSKGGGRLPLIALKRSGGVAQFCRAILGQDKISLSVVRLMVNYAVDYQHTQGLIRGPGQIGVDGAYHVDAKLFFRCLSLL